jgi:hypothetical protein
MPGSPAPRTPIRLPRVALAPALALTLALALVVAACGPAGGPASAFDPAAPCPAEGQQPGAYPELEARLPATFEDRSPDRVDSGRLCTEGSLGSLADAGVAEVRFAGATWHTGGTSGLTLAVFEGRGVDAGGMLEFYAGPAETARRTEKLVRSDTTVGEHPARRLDVLGSDGTGQTVVTWQVPGEPFVRVLLAADLGDARVAALLADLGTR